MQNFEYQVAQELRKRNRVFARSLFPMDHEVLFRQSGVNASKKGTLHSISQSGIFIRSTNCPEIGTTLNMTFPFGSHQRIQCEGQVIYTNKMAEAIDNTPGFGVKFTRMLTQDYNVIKDSVDTFFDIMK